MSEPSYRKTEAFFGRRKTQGLSKKQARLFDELLPKLSLDPKSAAFDDLSHAFSGTPERIVLEIGFGAGEHLRHQAQENSRTGFIGVEPFINSMAKMLSALDGQGFHNIRLYDDDATILLDWLPPQSIDRIDLLYPDPWPKRRHWKRRFVNAKNLDRFARALKPGGRFHFASDIDTYINWTLNQVHRHRDFQWIASCANDWQEPYENWVQTRYEAKAMREGRTPNYLRFERT